MPPHVTSSRSRDVESTRFWAAPGQLCTWDETLSQCFPGPGVSGEGGGSVAVDRGAERKESSGFYQTSVAPYLPKRVSSEDVL